MVTYHNDWVRLKLTSASSADTLRYFNQKGMILRKIRQIDELTVTFVVQRAELERINRFAQSRGERIELLQDQSIQWGMRRFFRRPVLIIGVLFIIFLSIFLPSRVLFIEVEGNLAVPSRFIIEQAALCGIKFGTAARQVRSEKIKNELLQRIPQLQWAGINTSGCTAVISVREKTQPEKTESIYPISSIVALRDGYVTEIYITAGSAGCKAGESVKEGQVLISAYTDCGLYIQAVKAKGEVYANTNRYSAVLTPSTFLTEGNVTSEYKMYSLLIGKNQINFSKDSRISGAICDRIKSVHHVTLPGGFQLPIALAVVRELRYDVHTTELSEDEVNALLKDTAHAQLNNTMLAGKILHAQESVTSVDGAYLMEGCYQCSEMIGISRTEEIMNKHE